MNDDMKKHDEAMQGSAGESASESASESIGDRNVARLLGAAYDPEPIDAAMLARVQAALRAAARCAPQAAPRDVPPISAVPAPANEFSPTRWQKALACAVAASLVIGLFSLAASRSRRSGEEAKTNKTIDAPSEPPQIAQQFPPVLPRQITADGNANPRILAAARWKDEKYLKASAVNELPKVETLALGATIKTGRGERRHVALADGSEAWLNEQTTLRADADRRLTLSAGEAFFEVAPREIAGAGGKLREPFLVETPHRSVKALGTKFAVEVAPAKTEVVVAQGKVAVDGVAQPLLASEQVVTTDDVLKQAAQSLPQIERRIAPRVSHVLDWARDLYAASSPVLVPVSQYTGGALVTRDAGGQETRLSLRKYRVDVYIEDGFARTTIDQTYFNHLQSRQEGTFMFPLPADASISRLAMYVNGKLMEGGMAERQHAAEVFDAIKRKMQDPALLEWIDGTTFRMRVFPLEAREEKRIVLSYTQRLPSLYGKATYRFPSGHNLGEVGHWAANVHVRNAAEQNWSSPTHSFAAVRSENNLTLTSVATNAKLDKDLVVELTAKAGAAQSHVPSFACADHEGSHYVMVRQRLELPRDVHHERRDWIVLVETSADRDPLLARTQVEAVRSFLGNIEHTDTFTILAANTQAKQLTDGMPLATVENVANAVARLEDRQLLGALDLEASFAAIAPLAAGAANPHFVHFGSGQAALGARDAAQLAAKLPAKAKYIGVGVGKRWNRAFMKLAASRTGGYFTQINPDEDVRWRALDLVATLNTSRLLDVQVVDDTGRAWQSFTDTIADGEELCATTRLDGAAPAKAGATEAAPATPAAKQPTSITITGKLDGREYRQTFPIRDVAANAGYLPRMWAKLEIDRLLAADAAANKDRIVELSKAMYVMSPFTSLLVLENEQMYADFKVDRGRKDHWAMYPCPETIEVVREPLVYNVPVTQPAGAQTPFEAEVEKYRQQTAEVLGSVIVQPYFFYRRGYVNSVGQWVDANPLVFQTLNGNYAVDFDGDGIAEPAGFLPYTNFGEGAGINQWDLYNFHGNPALLGAMDGRGIVYSQFGNDPRMNWSRANRFSGARGYGGFGSSTLQGLDGTNTLFGTNNLWIEPNASDWTKAYYGLQSGRNHWGYFTNGSSPVRMFQRYDEANVPLKRSRGRWFDDNVDAYRLAERDRLAQVVTGPVKVVAGTDSSDYRFTQIVGGNAQNDFLAKLRYQNALGLPVNTEMDLRQRVAQEYAMPMYEDVELRFRSPTFGDLAAREDRFGWAAYGDPAAWSSFDSSGFSDGSYLLQEMFSDLEGLQGLDAAPLLITEALGSNDRRKELSDLIGGLQVVGSRRVQDLGAARPIKVIPRIPPAPSQFPGPKLNLLYQGLNLAGIPQSAVRYPSLLSFAPGLHTSPADLKAVVEAELPIYAPKRGKVADGARVLIDRARAAGWQRVQIPQAAPAEPLTVDIDGLGRYRYQAYTPEGLGEETTCDGQTEWRLYRELGIGAKRTVSRFHRAAAAQFAPWFVPPADDLACDADLELIDARTVSIVKTFKLTKVDAKQAAPKAPSPDEDSKDSRTIRFEQQLVFGTAEQSSDRLTERRWLLDGKLLARVTYSASGDITWFNADGKSQATASYRAAPIAAPDMTVSIRDVVVLPMPWRRWGTGPTATLKDGKALDYLKYTEEEAMAALSAFIAGNDASAVQELIARRFFAAPAQVEGKTTPADRRLGFYGILCLAGCNWQPDALVKQGGVYLQNIPASPLADHPQSKIAYLLAYELGQRNIGHPAPTKEPAYRGEDCRHSLAATLLTLRQFDQSADKAKLATLWPLCNAFVHNTRSPVLAIGVLHVMQATVANTSSASTHIALGYDRWEKNPQWNSYTRYEAARAWLKSGDADRAEKGFTAWHADELAAGRLPRIDADFVTALQARAQQLEDRLPNVVKSAALKLVAQNQHAMALLLAWQMYQLQRNDLGEALLDITLTSLPADRTQAATLAAVEVLWHVENYGRADQMLTPLLAAPDFKDEPALWRLAAWLAEKQGRWASAVSRWERVAALADARLPQSYDVAAARAPYESLLASYKKLVEALATLEQKPSPDLVARVVRAADRWRSLDADPTAACNAAADVLSSLGASDLAWDYVTTPIAAKGDLPAANPAVPTAPVEGQPGMTTNLYLNLARSLMDQRQIDLASRAYQAASAADPTNAGILWDQAHRLETNGQFEAARAIYRRIVDGKFPADQDNLKQQAAERLNQQPAAPKP